MNPAEALLTRILSRSLSMDPSLAAFLDKVRLGLVSINPAIKVEHDLDENSDITFYLSVGPVTKLPLTVRADSVLVVYKGDQDGYVARTVTAARRRLADALLEGFVPG